MIRVRRHPAGPRVYVLGRRCHHGTAGVLALALGAVLGARRPGAAVRIAGAVLVAHDHADFPFTDRCNHVRRRR